MQKIVGAASLLLAAAALIAACGDDDGVESSREPSCDALAGLESYRFTLSLMLDAPVFDEGPTASPAGPLDEFSEALTALFSDLRLEGAHVAPDRTQVVLTFEDEELEWRAIGDRSWVRFGDEWEEQEGTSARGVLTPEVVCEDIVEDLGSSLSGGGEEETISGVEAYHYTVDRDDISELPDLLGGGSPALPDEVDFDIWLAQDGLWPVKISLRSTDAGEDEEPVMLSLDVELSDVGDEGIEIKVPEAEEDAGED